MIGNYRPVPLTCIACKIMDSLVKDVIVDHLLSKNLTVSTQHGFMEKLFLFDQLTGVN